MIKMVDTTEKSSLVSKSSWWSRWITRVKIRYSKSFVMSGRAILCLFWLGISLNLDLATWASWAVLIPSNKNSFLSKAFPFIISCIYLFWPVLGYISERWTRYYVIMVGVAASCFTTLILQVILLWKSLDSSFTSNSTITVVVIVCLTICGVGVGLIYANMIQFTTDQMQQASSEELASFTRWWVFTDSFSFGFAFSLFLFLHSICDDDNCFAQTVFIVTFVFSVPAILIGIYFKRYFVIEPPPTDDPLKLVYRVLKYAWKHKYPERRSAFTYNDDPPSRLDYGKDRYGGPFTTDQVESVRSFGYVLAVIVSNTVSSSFSVEIHKTLNDNIDNATDIDDLVEYFLFNPNLPQTLIPLFFQLLFIPLCPCLVPSMLKRMWFGLLLNTLSYVVSLIAVYSGISSSYILLIVYIIGNIGSAIAIFSSLEFILAQAPIYFHGLLIGVYCISFGDLSSIFLTLNTYTRYCIVTGLMCVSFIAYSVVMYYYKYCLRNELSDINMRRTVEEIYERNLNQRPSSDHVYDDLLVHSSLL